VSAAALFASDPSVIAHIGPAYSDTSYDVIRATCASGLLVILPHGPWTIMSDIEGVRVEHDLFERCDERNVAQLDAAAESRGFALAKRLDELRVRRIWPIADTTAEAAIFQRALEAAGIKFVGVTTVREQGTERTAVIDGIVSSSADAVVYLGHEDTEAYQVWLEVMERLPRARFLATSAVVMAEKDEVDGIEKIGVLEIEHMDPSAAAFEAAYKERFGSYPGYWARFAYDAAGIIVQALSAALADDPDATEDELRDRIRREVVSERRFSGSIHAWAFTSQGFPVEARLSVLRLIDGSWRPVKPVEVDAPR
jgi:hypothetical protein